MTSETYWECVSALHREKDHCIEMLSKISENPKLVERYTWNIEKVEKAMEELEEMRYKIAPIDID